ncbi:MAG TPA: ATP-binding protein, partial [Holophaga sp.]|nr:ATP-binding protein [Holophaga sp.]
EVDLLRHTTLGKVQVVLDLDEALPGIQGAASDLGSAIMNLSVNALDAMPAGGTLIFRTRGVRGGWVEVAVSDSGQGMTPEVLAKALEPFFTTKPKGRGTGLGLSRVYGTVKAHGGSVEIQSAPGRGTTVLIRLPSRAATVRRSEAPDTGPEATEALRILLVDDEPILLDTLCDALQAAGHAVEPVASGEAALARLAAPLRFDLVLLDHNMPGLSGLQTLIQIRQRHPGLPVILSSGFLDPETEASLEGMPQAWVLKKPYSTQELQATFARIARSRVQA